MDFLRNPIGNEQMKPFDLDDLEQEAGGYLRRAGATQKLPIERLAHMNEPAIEIYQENGIDLFTEPLEIAVCAQHNNGGFSVDRWWQSSVPGTFVIGEMAGTHGVKRPGGSALNSGQTGGLRAAEYIANQRSLDTEGFDDSPEEVRPLVALIEKLRRWTENHHALSGGEALQEIQRRMSSCAAHIRELSVAKIAFDDAVRLVRTICDEGLRLDRPKDLIAAVRAEHLALASAAYLKAIVELLSSGSGSRGSHLVLADDGQMIHPAISRNGKPLRFKPENASLRSSIQQIEFDPDSENLFRCTMIAVRPMPKDRKAFEPAWQDFRERRIYSIEG